MNSLCVLKIKEIGKNIMFVILNIVCFILLRYLTILIIFLIGGYASNQFIDSYWYFFPSYFLQVLVLIIIVKKSFTKTLPNFFLSFLSHKQLNSEFYSVWYSYFSNKPNESYLGDRIFHLFDKLSYLRDSFFHLFDRLSYLRDSFFRLFNRSSYFRDSLF